MFLEFHFVTDKAPFLVRADKIRAIIKVSEDDPEFAGHVSLITDDGELIIQETYEEVKAKINVAN